MTNLICRFCNKTFESSGGRAMHERYCQHRSQLEIELRSKLDDDGKLYSRWQMKCHNAELEGLKCLLTFEQYCILVDRANLISSQLGYSGQNYVLARYNDKGDYTFDNCRFITQQCNSDEKTISERVRENGRIQVKRMNECNKLRPEYMSQRIHEGMQNSQYYKDKRARAVENEAKRRAQLNPAFSGIHNSQYGTFWITDGRSNIKWRSEKGPFPEGFYRGRIIK